MLYKYLDLNTEKKSTNKDLQYLHVFIKCRGQQLIYQRSLIYVASHRKPLRTHCT